MLIAAGVIALAAVHAVVLYGMSTRVALPAAGVAGIVAVVVIQHVALFAGVRARLRR